MKLLLTSNGLSNELICDALEGLVKKPRKEMKIAFIPTAAFCVDEQEHESRDWLVNDLYTIKEFCGFIDIVSLADLTRKHIKERLEFADVIFVGGGNTFYLSYCMERSGLFELLPELLKSRVYAGISAGSMIATSSLRTASQAIYDTKRFSDGEYDEFGPDGMSGAKTANLVNFVVRPHLNSYPFPSINGDFLKDIASDVQVPLYAIDDQCAVKVDDDQIQIVGDGQFLSFNS